MIRHSGRYAGHTFPGWSKMHNHHGINVAVLDPSTITIFSHYQPKIMLCSSKISGLHNFAYIQAPATRHRCIISASTRFPEVHRGRAKVARRHHAWLTGKAGRRPPLANHHLPLPPIPSSSTHPFLIPPQYQFL